MAPGEGLPLALAVAIRAGFCAYLFTRQVYPVSRAGNGAHATRSGMACKKGRTAYRFGSVRWWKTCLIASIAIQLHRKR